jgi:Xaa-Pro aminopeptidase
MGALGQPSALAREMHAACVEVQDAVRRLLRPGVRYGDVADGGNAALQQRRIAGAEAHLTSHGIGMVSHEQPTLNVPAQRERTLQAGHVCSVETEYLHPDVGHVKIEDTIAITPDGSEGYGDLGRDWQIVEVGSGPN